MTEPKPIEHKILTLYLLKRIADKTKNAIAELKTVLLPTGATETIKIADGKLNVTFTSKKAKKQFDLSKAEEVLRKIFTPEEFNAQCTDVVITSKGLKIPPEISAQLQEYFNVERVVTIDETYVKGAPLSDEQLEECYTRGANSFTMTTPSNVSNEELLDIARSKNLDVTSTLLLEDK